MLFSKQKVIRAAIAVALILIATLIIVGIIAAVLPKNPDKGDFSDDINTENETRAVWISFLEMQEILTEKSESEFTI